MDLANPEDWYNESGGVYGAAPLEVGAGMVELYQTQGMWDNRTAPKVHQAFAEILGSEELWVTMDRCNFKPPCRGEDDGWARGLPLHWDGPRPDIGTPYVKETSVQGALFLTDCGPGSGGCERTQRPPALILCADPRAADPRAVAGSVSHVRAGLPQGVGGVGGNGRAALRRPQGPALLRPALRLHEVDGGRGQGRGSSDLEPPAVRTNRSPSLSAHVTC